LSITIWLARPSLFNHFFSTLFLMPRNHLPRSFSPLPPSTVYFFLFFSRFSFFQSSPDLRFDHSPVPLFNNFFFVGSFFATFIPFSLFLFYTSSPPFFFSRHCKRSLLIFRPSPPPPFLTPRAYLFLPRILPPEKPFSGELNLPASEGAARTFCRDAHLQIPDPPVVSPPLLSTSYPPHPFSFFP